MSVNKDMQVSTFSKGLSLDPSDMVLPNDTMRYGQNVRIINNQSSSFVATNLQGTDVSFQLTSGYEPVAIQEYAGVLYIISWNSTNGYLELGSYPSPAYSGGSINAYRPLNNYNNSDFRVPPSVFGTQTANGKPIIQKLELQFEYDQSVNMCFTIKGQKPRIVNTKFTSTNNGTSLSVLPARTGLATSNEYTTSSVDKETQLILSSSKILKIDFTGIENGGGALKPGNYHYVFYYLSEDFNRTSVIGQSSTCQVFFGDNENSVIGGDETQMTSKRVKLTLSNLDTDFKYLKVYVMYSSGQNTLTQQYLEFVQPIEITSENNFVFTHTGYEELTEVSQEEVNIDYASIQSAYSMTQVGGYLMLGGIKEREYTFSSLKTAAGQITPVLAKKTLSIASGLYQNASNTYNYLGYMSGETYAFAIVFIMKDGSLSPAFPIKSKNQGNTAVNDGKGIVTFNYATDTSWGFYDSSAGALNNSYAKYITLDISTLLADAGVTDQTIGFFIVRAERRENRIAQGILVPTIKAPTVEAPDGTAAKPYNTNPDEGGINAGGYYLENGDDASVNDISVYKHLINLDSLMEAYYGNRQGTSNDKVVVTDSNALQDGYIPCYIRDVYSGTNYSSSVNTSIPFPKKIWFSKTTESWARHWAFISGEALMNEPEFINSLQRENLGIHQLFKLNFKVGGLVTPLAYLADFSSLQFGCHYNMVGNASTYTGYSQGSPLKLVNRCVYVPDGTLATGTDFISRFKASLITKFFTNNTAHIYVNQKYDSYFGVEFKSGSTSAGPLQDATYSASNPIGGNLRSGKGAENSNVDARYDYSNYNKVVPAAFLVNIYPQEIPPTPNDLYPSVDNLTYRQVTKRFAWTDFPATPTTIEVFGGDCYISKVSRKISRGPDSDSSIAYTDAYKRANINSGLVITWLQESKYNLNLRQPKQYDASELEKRSFHPYRNLGDVVTYRNYRLPETVSHSLGYSYLLPPKSSYTVSPFTPYEKNEFMTRVYHSDKHIPNAFKNGYRSFGQTSYQDYDTAMGPIVGMFNHRGNLLVVFQNGIGIGPINQRVETARDTAGSIFIQPSTVLPPTLTYLSKEIGCQDNLALVQTPGAVYGMDRAKDKIWVIQEGLKVISDEAFVASWIINNPIINPRVGYDLENNEVLFATNNWTLCYSEGIKRFSSFYTMNNVSYFTRRNKEMYTFTSTGNKAQAYLNNSATVFGNLYGQSQSVIVEFTVNKNLGMTKIFDYINIISNEIPPSKIEFLSYNQTPELGPVITPTSANINQYTSVLDTVNTLKDEPNILYRDKKYVIQVPVITNHSDGSLVDDVTWGVGTRLKDKMFIVRLTYNTDKSLELASVLSYFRYSKS